MADFNVSIDTPSIPDFSGRSRGWDPAPATKSGAIEKSALAETVQYAGSFLDSLEKGARGMIMSDISETILDARDELNNTEGVPDAETIFGNENRLPSQIGEAESQLKNLDKARQAGTISELAYAARLQTTAQQLRSRFPSFRGEIDTMFQKHTGMVPANEIRRQLNERASQASKEANAEEKQRMELAERMRSDGTLPNGWETMSRSQLINYSAPIHRELKKAEYLKLQADVNKDNVNMSREFQVQSAHSLRKGSMSAYFGELNIPREELGNKSAMQLIQEFNKTGAKPSVEDAAQLAQLIEQGRSRVVGGLQQRLTTDYTLNSDDMKSVVGAANMWFDTAQDAITNNQYGFFSLENKKYEANKIAEENDFVSSIPGMKTGRAAYRAMGQAGADLVANYMDTQMKDSVNQAILARLTEEVVTSRDNGKGFASHLAQLQAQGKATPELVKGLTETARQLASDSKVGREARMSAVAYLMGDGNRSIMSTLNSANRTQYFDMVTSMAPVIKELNDPALTQQYEGWLKESFLTANQLNSNTLQSTRVNSGTVDIKYNPTTYQFDVIPTGKTIGDPLTILGAPNIVSGVRRLYNDNIITKPGVDAVENINASIRAILPMLKAQGKDPNEYLKGAFGIMGINEEQAKERWRSNGEMWSGMISSMATAVGETVAPNMTKKVQDLGTREQLKGRMDLGLSQEDLAIVVPSSEQVSSETGDAMELNELTDLLSKTNDPAIREEVMKVIKDLTSRMKGSK